MTYRIEWRPAAAKALEGLPRDLARRIYARLSSLADDARPSGCEKLAGGHNEYRVRVGDYRIVYAVEDRAVLVLVLVIGHRREVYRR